MHFKQPAGTSRGVYTKRTVHLIKLIDPDDPTHIGIGECAPLPDLSCDDPYLLTAAIHNGAVHLVNNRWVPYDKYIDFPSAIFALETAWLHYQRRSYRLFDTPFSRGEAEIAVNGLVWMGTYDEMLGRMEQKLQQGYKCVKLKIGAIDFEKELDLIRIVRSAFPASRIELRVDANGAFAPDEAMRRLDALSKFDIHSIEQPIMKGRWKSMARLCRESPIPIAFDEELIGANRTWQKEELLDSLHPAYIVLKPSLHGGMRGTREWVDMARQRGIGSWITSALESNIGLNAVAHLAADIYGPDVKMTQGLGTGRLYEKNFDLPYSLEISEGKMRIAE